MKALTEETRIKKEIKDYLNLKRWFHFHNLAGLGSYPGIPDIIAIKNKIVLFIEVKTEKGSLSQKQREFKMDIENHGGNYIIARGYEDIEKYIKEKRL